MGEIILNPIAVLAAFTTILTPQFGQRKPLPPAIQDPGWNLGHTRRINNLSFSPDSTLIASCAEDASVRIWDAKTGTLLKTLTTGVERYNCMKFSPDGKLLATVGKDNMVQVWSVPDFSLISKLAGHTATVCAISWSRIGNLLASGGFDGQLIIWNLASGTHSTIRTSSSSVNGVNFVNGDSSVMAHCYYIEKSDSTFLFDVVTGAVQDNWQTGQRYRNLNYKCDAGITAIYNMNGQTDLCDTETGKRLHTFAKSPEKTPAIVFAPDGKRIVISAISPDHKPSLLVWNVERNAVEYTLHKLHGNRVVAISPDGKQIAAAPSSSESNRVRLYNSQTEKEIWASADPALILASKPGLPLLKQLAEDYDSYRLPRLPQSSLLALIVPSDPGDGSQFEPFPRFVSKSDDPQKQFTYNRGFHKREIDKKYYVREVSPEGVTSARLKSLLLRSDRFDIGIVIAIQAYQRGWSKTGLEYMTVALAKYRRDARRDFATIAYDYWWYQISEPSSDRSSVLASMRTVLASGLYSPEHKDTGLLNDLEASLKPSTAPPGSIEAEIDALVDFHDKGYGRADVWSLSRQLPRVADPRYSKLWLRGFDAVPALMRHLDDPRLTRYYNPGEMNGVDYVVRVGQVVSCIVSGLANGTEAIGITGSPEHYEVKTTLAGTERWWKAASVLGEEKYLLQNVLPEKDDSNETVNVHNAVLIAVKYPFDLPEVYRAMITRFPHSRKWTLAQLIKESNLPLRVRLPLLVQGATTGDDQQRQGALRQLVDMKRPEAAEIVLHRITSLPSTPPGPYCTCEAGWISSLAAEIDRPDLWLALHRLAVRSDVWQRLEIIHEVMCLCGKKLPHRHAVDFALKFVNDLSVRVAPTNRFAGSPENSRYEGPFADGDVDRITVRDSVLRNIGYAIGAELSPNFDWPKPRMDAWRKSTLLALKQYLARNEH